MADQDHSDSSEMAVRIATALAAAAAAFIVQRALAMGWRAVTGRSAPRADDATVSVAEIVTYTALTSAVVATARVLAARKAHDMTDRRAAS
jgi:hypothetical protein